MLILYKSKVLKELSILLKEQEQKTLCFVVYLCAWQKHDIISPTSVIWKQI